MKSIKSKILLNSVVITVAAAILLGAVSTVLTYNSIKNTLSISMRAEAQTAAETIEQSLSAKMTSLTEAAATALFRDGKPSDAGVIAECKGIAERSGFSAVGMTDADGVTGMGISIGGEEYFKRCKQKEAPVISEVAVNTITNVTTVTIIVPIMKDGQFAGTVYGMGNADFLCSLVSDITVGETGFAYVIDKEGTVIAHPTTDIVNSKTNYITAAERDDSYKKLAEINTEMIVGHSGFDTYKLNGVSRYIGYAPISGSDGMSAAVCVNTSEFNGAFKTSIIFTVVIVLVLIVVSGIISAAVAGKIADPVKECAERIRKLAAGDISSPVPIIRADDETGVLANASAELVGSLGSIIRDIDNMLNAMSDGNFNVHSENKAGYVGDFSNIINSLENIKRSMSGTLARINTAADEVSGSAESLAKGSEALSDGASEQAASVQQLAATINDIAAQVKLTAQNSDATKLAVEDASNTLNGAANKMNALSAAMDEIKGFSAEINKIIKTIDDIAFQTNILALNAAVEAAHAGAAGKGFAVVADEVRNLASKSADAVKNTTKLIHDTVSAIENGAVLANEGVAIVSGVSESTHELLGTITQIADAAKSQSESIQQVTSGVSSISGVVQSNSENAEHSAEASRQLSEQADLLKELAGKFVLYDENSSDDEENDDDDSGYDFSRFDHSDNAENNADTEAETASADNADHDEDEAPSYDFSRFETKPEPVSEPEEETPSYDFSRFEKKAETPSVPEPEAPTPIKAEAVKPAVKAEPIKPTVKAEISKPVTKTETLKPVVREEPKASDPAEEFVPYDFAADIDLNSVDSISLDDDDDKY